MRGGGAESLTEQSPIDRPRCWGAQHHWPEDRNGHERQRHPNGDTGQSHRRFTHSDERGDPSRPLGCVPEGEHAAERVTHDQGRLEFEGIEEFVQEQNAMVANAVDTVGVRAREAVAGQLDEMSSVAGEPGDQRRPDGRGKAHAMKHHDRGSGADAEYAEANICSPELDIGLGDLKPVGLEQL